MAVMDGYSEWAYETRIRQINEWRRTIGEFSATSKASSEKETQTFLRSKNVYGELDATNEMSAEKEKWTHPLRVHGVGAFMANARMESMNEWSIRNSKNVEYNKNNVVLLRINF